MVLYVAIIPPHPLGPNQEPPTHTQKKITANEFPMKEGFLAARKPSRFQVTRHARANSEENLLRFFSIVERQRNGWMDKSFLHVITAKTPPELRGKIV